MTALEEPLRRVEVALSALGKTLFERDPVAILRHARELHAALASAVERFADAARAGGVPAELRRRLAAASAQVAAQRETLRRATAALGREVEVFWPRDAALYRCDGLAERRTEGAAIRL